MQSRDYRTSRQYWNPNNLGYGIIAGNQELKRFLKFSKIFSLLNDDEILLWKKFKSKKRKDEWLLGRFAAKSIIRDRLALKNLEEVSLNEIRIISSPNLKPGSSLISGDLSISHSENLAVAVVANKTNFMVGVDIEKTRKVSEKVYRYFLTNSEVKLLKQNKDGNILATIFWTFKEAALKALGIGLRGQLKGINIKRFDDYQALLSISEYNLKTAGLKKPKNLYAFYRPVNQHHLATVFLEY